MCPKELYAMKASVFYYVSVTLVRGLSHLTRLSFLVNKEPLLRQDQRIIFHYYLKILN